MSRILLDKSSTGVEHYVHVGDREIVLEEFAPTSVDQIILDEAHRLRNTEQRKGAALRHAATVPINLYQGWRKEWRRKYSDKWEWRTYLAMKLNSPDYAYLRTGVKRL